MIQFNEYEKVGNWIFFRSCDKSNAGFKKICYKGYKQMV